MASGILCFEHCNCRIFCLNLPNCCARCNKRLDQLDIMPFRDYNNSTDLHIGLTTSSSLSGLIVEYDQNGLRYHSPDEWNESLLIVQLPLFWYDSWDRNICEILETKRQFWTIENYHLETNNCYTFVMEVLRQLDCELFRDRLRSKIEFCEYFIVPKMKKVRKYISLYRKLATSEFVVEENC